MYNDILCLKTKYGVRRTEKGGGKVVNGRLECKDYSSMQHRAKDVRWRGNPSVVHDVRNECVEQCVAG